MTSEELWAKVNAQMEQSISPEEKQLRDELSEIQAAIKNCKGDFASRNELYKRESELREVLERKYPGTREGLR